MRNKPQLSSVGVPFITSCLPPRRRYLLAVMLCFVSISSSGRESFAEGPGWTQSDRVAIDVADLQDQLQGGLKARLPREFAFIGRVVALVRAGEMPTEMVVSTYHWARLKHPRPYPYPYFEAALRMRAREANIEF